MSFLIYGATGYTGQLVAARAKAEGLSPILAGRDEAKTREVAARHGFDWRAFELAERQKLETALADVALVLHIAGPFSATSEPMADACLATGTHYLDITGEIDVFEALAARDGEAQRAGVMLLPGVGFDVVPTDCLALHLKNRLPDATVLKLIVTGLGHMSRGTAKTGVEAIGQGPRVRRDGRIVELDDALYERFMVGNAEKRGAAVSWGDVATAYHTTGIGDITVFFEATKEVRQLIEMPGLLRWFFSTALGQRFLKRQIDKRPPGPTEEQRAAGHSVILGVARNAAGDEVRSLLTTPEGYTLTAMTALEIVRRVESGAAEPGFKTPAGLFGADFITTFEGCERQDLS